MIKQFAPCVKKYWWAVLLSPVTVIIEVLLEVRIPMLMSQIVDTGITNQDLRYVVNTGVQMVVFALCSLVAGALSAWFASIAGMGLGAGLRESMFGRVQDFAFSNVDRFSTASLVTRLTTDVNRVQMTFMMLIRVCVRAPVMLVSATVLAWQLNGELVTVFLIAIPVLGGLLALIATRAFPRFQVMLEKFDGLNARVQETLMAIRVVKAFVRSKFEKEKFEVTNEDLKRSSIMAEKILVWNGPLMTLAMNACIVAIVWFGGKLIAFGSMETGQLMSFISYVTQILMSLMMITNTFVMIVMSKASANRICEVLRAEPDIGDAAADPALTVPDGSIEMRHVSFRYHQDAEKPVLSDINLSIRSGETIGIIGGTGSAKSTLVQMIPRLYEAQEGEVLVGGHSVTDYTLDHLRGAVAMVLQKNVLFSGTIRENLLWGNPEATQEEIIEACKAAQAHDFIMSFPDGYETNLGQGGVNVSGGQKQRLCIARALLKDPKILILDDSTSAVDTATDSKIREALRAHRINTTTLIIAQRVTSVCEADRIIVLDDGKIDDIGTHEELLARNQIYREVYHSQQEGVAS
uniref:ABC transporter ATP-binding protein n=1 Tax=Candidatus Fimivicinus sp. TaxID=3056640 RepID=UPI003FEF059A